MAFHLRVDPKIEMAFRRFVQILGGMRHDGRAPWAFSKATIALNPRLPLCGRQSPPPTKRRSRCDKRRVSSLQTVNAFCSIVIQLGFLVGGVVSRQAFERIPANHVAATDFIDREV
jgi:hypothetical protein